MGSVSLPGDKGGLSRLIEERGWRGDPRRARFAPGAGRLGGTWEYHLTLLPAEVRAALLAREFQAAVGSDPSSGCSGPSPDPFASERVTLSRSGRGQNAALWERFEGLPEKGKAEARERLRQVEQVDTLSAGGMARQAAVALTAREAGVSTSTLWGWLRLAGVAKADRLPALAPRRQGRTATADCDPRAWDFLVADYLRPEQPSFDACHRRLALAAAEHGWEPVPSAKTLRRRLDATVPRAAAVLARKGRHAAQALFPHQTRDKASLAAMEAVNADGHRFDVFVRWEDGTVGRAVMTAFQDVHSGMLLAHRLDRSENWNAVRLCIADLIERHGIPDHVVFDNGRHFASKWITSATKYRFRFKHRDGDPAGILPNLGCQVHFTTPYHGQAKPIERAFRDLCEDIAKHPACAGAYTGNKPDAKPANYGSKAVPIAAFRILVAAEIERHNGRGGRRSATAKGRSLAETFQASLAGRELAVRWAGPVQRRMFLLAAEGVTASRRTGEVTLGENRYWAEPLVELAGRKVIVRYDPDDLTRPLAVYSGDDRFVCEAPCIAQTGFFDMAGARETAGLRSRFVKNQRERLDLERRLGIGRVAELLEASAPEPAAAERPKVVRLVANGTPVAWPAAANDPSESFSRGLEAVFGRGVRPPSGQGGGPG